MYDFSRMTEEHVDECVDLYIDVFSQAPWNDTFQSREQVVNFFINHMSNNYFVGFILKEESGIIALSLGYKKPWINGMEYYIDQFFVKAEMQGKGIGSHFLKLIENNVYAEKMNAVILNTERGFPAENFYFKNGYMRLDESVVMAKVLEKITKEV